MTEAELRPGNKVVELAAVVRTASLLTGAIVAALVSWIAKHKLTISCLSFVSGAIVGYVIGLALGRILFPATDGNVVVAKAGIASLRLTLKGGIFGSLLASLVVAVANSFFVEIQITLVIGPALGIGAIVGIVFACLASLL
jgi:hypothetical protein